MKKRIAMLLCITMVIVLTLQAYAISTVTVKSITLEKSQITLNVAKTYDLSVIFTPLNATQKLLSYSTASKKIATVDKAGKITAIAKGTTMITVTSSSNKNLSVKCTVNVVPAISISKPVALSMYVIGEAPAGMEAVNTELNKKLKKDINASIKFNILTSGDYDKKYPLILASGEAFDLIYSANWIAYDSQAQKGGFMALDTLLPKYAPQLNNVLPKAALEQCKVNGKLYMIPALEVGTIANGFMVRGDILKKYNLAPPTTLESFAAYLDTVKKNMPDLIPLNLAGTRAEVAALTALIIPKGDLWTGGFGLGLNILGSRKDPAKIFTTYLTPEYETFVKLMKTWADKGYWSKSMLSNKVGAGDAFKNGTSAACITNIVDADAKYQEIMKNHPDWAPQYCTTYPDLPCFRDVYKGNGVSLGASSKNPERALMFLELMDTNEAYHDLTFYGIKGTNYNLTSGNKRQVIEGKPIYAGENISVWGWANPKFTKFPANIMPGYEKIIAADNARAVDSPYATFVLNTDNIKTQIAAMVAVRDQYATPLSAGMVDDVDSSLNTLKTQLKAAGLDTVLAEVKKQVGEYLKTKK